MAKTTIKLFFMLLLALAASTALSDDNQGQNNNNQGGGWVRQAPEFDPASAMGALALLGGTLAIIRGYRSRDKK